MQQDIVWVESTDENSHEFVFRTSYEHAKILKPRGNGSAVDALSLASVQHDLLPRSFFYGKGEGDEFLGLSEFYNTGDHSISHAASNVLNAGGRGDKNSSIYFVCWGERTVYFARSAAGKCALVPTDWRFVVRIANIKEDGNSDLARLLLEAVLTVPTLTERPIIYAPELLKKRLETQGVDQKFRDIIIRFSPELHSNEARVT